MVTESTTHHRYVANGIKFHYAEAGEEPPVVLLHGFPGPPMLVGIRSRP
jgi:pimeloyl-ACP methyl ester carboxylesterase